MHIVVTRPVLDEGIAPLREHHTVHVHEPDGTADTTEDDLIEMVGEAPVLISTVSDPVTPRVFEACPQLEIVAQYGVGLDNVDLEAAEQHGVIVTHTPGVLTDATADFTMALLLAAARHLRAADQYVRDGQFERWETTLLLGMELHGKTLGIVGMGRIGKAVARRALGFGMRILYHNRRRANPTDERILSATYASLDDVLAQSDVVTLHCPHNEDSHHLIDADALRRMKSSALLINTARGPIVDEGALVDALRDGIVAGAGLDVFEREPEVHPGLMDVERVILAPHLASATVEARTQMGAMCTEAVLAFANGADTIPYRAV